jgi:PAS domain S-box-containing protein
MRMTAPLSPELTTPPTKPCGLPLGDAASVLDLVSDAVILWDENGRIAYRNKAAEYILDENDSKTFGETCPQSASGAHAPMTSTTASDSAPDQDYWEGQVQEHRWDGSEIMLRRCRIVLRNELGKRSGLLQLDTNITCQYETERLLARERKFSIEMIEASTDGILAFDRECRTTLWNPAMEKMAGISRDEALGRYLYDLLPFLWQGGEDKHFQAVLEGRSSVSRDRHFLVTSTGCNGLYDAWYRPIRGLPEAGEELGSVIGGLTIFRDCTRAKALEDSLRQLSARLLQLQDEERRRVARELHDGTIQLLAGLTLTLAALNDRLKTKTQFQLLDECSEMTNRAIRELRTLSYLLHPPELDAVGLASAVQVYVEGFAQRTGLDVQVDVSDNFGRQTKEIETTIFRIVQESLVNIHRHSGSKTATISLQQEASSVIVEIVDEGGGIAEEVMQGIDQGMRRLGVGIAGMFARVKQLSGHLEITSTGHGTRILVVLPIAEEQSHAKNSGNL